jgi:hypothetical protein
VTVPIPEPLATSNSQPRIQLSAAPAQESIYETEREADPEPEKASTAKTWKLKFLLAKPCLAQALKWLAVVMVPEVRLLCLTDQYWVKVEVPVMEGWLVRVSVQRV